MTILFTCNAAGTHKLKPLAVGKFQSPRCLHHVNIATLLVLTHSAASTLRTPDGQIFVKYLAKNTTLKIQPCDASIIKSFKALYKKELVMEMLDLPDTTTDYLKELTLKDSFYLTAKAWEAVFEATMRNCWRKALGGAFDEEDAEEEVFPFDGLNATEIQIAQNQLEAHQDADLPSMTGLTCGPR
ncbi:unnamed protein product [Acanthosepion pharaonis]|nr:unnamed protein product [Sepia pharaonis]